MGKRNVIFAILLFQFAVLESLAFALPMTQKLQVSWSCPQTAKTSIPVHGSIDVKFNLKAGEFESPALDLIIEDMQKYPEIDFFDCLYRFGESNYYAARNLCKTIKALGKGKYDHELPACRSDEALSKSFARVTDKALKYAAAVYKTGGLTPFEPGEESSLAFGDLEYARMLDSAESTCKIQSVEYLERGFIQKFLPRLLKDSRCDLKHFVRDYSKLLLYSQLSSEQCRANPLGCKRRNKSVQKTIELLKKAGLNFEPFHPTDDCCTTGREDHFLQLQKRISSIVVETTSAVKCVQLEASDPPLVVDGDTGTGGYGRYLLKKTARGYEIQLGIFFKDSTEDKSADLQKFRENYKNCLKSEAPYMKGPQGELLEIKLFEGDSRKSAPPRIQIDVVSNQRRSNEVSWDQGASCPQMLHETLHLLGLKDVYRESWRGTRLVVDSEKEKIVQVDDNAEQKFFDCRIVGPNDSLMAHPSEAERSAHMKKIVSCVCSDSLCRKKIFQSKSTLESCPKEAVRREEEVRVRSIEEFPAGKWDQEYGYVLSSVPRNPRKGLTWFYPAEFRAVTRPGCIVENKPYFMCSKEAYKTSSKAYGRDKCDPGLPEVCYGENSEWMY